MAEYELIKDCRKGFAVTGVHLRGEAPDRVVRVSDNEVYAVYGNIKQTWTAEGSGNERHGFTETLTEVSTS